MVSFASREPLTTFVTLYLCLHFHALLTVHFHINFRVSAYQKHNGREIWYKFASGEEEL